MEEDTGLDMEIRRALSAVLDDAEGRYPTWGSSPHSARVGSTAGPRSRWLSSGRSRRAFASVALALTVALAGLVIITRGIGAPSPAGGGTVRVWAIAAISDTVLVAVGETGDSSIGMVARSTDAGRSWAITHPGVPALTTISAAGGSLLAATDCAAQYAGAGPSKGLTHPTSCLYESDDEGLTWHDLHQSAIVDPSFVDASHGFAHSPLDTVTGSPSRLYATSDGGRTWEPTASPCSSNAPWIAQAVAVEPTVADILCVTGNDQPRWELIQYKQGAVPVLLARPGSGAVGPDANVFGFSMRPAGQGLLFGDEIYRTTDNALTWTQSRWAGARVQGGSFTPADIGYFVVRDTGRSTGIITTTDGGSTWSELIQWPYFGP